MHFVTWVSERLKELSREAPNLWVGSRRNASAFLIAFAAIVGGATAFEMSEPWRLVRHSKTTPVATNENRLVHLIASQSATGADIVLLVGGSTMREATSGGVYLDDALTAVCARPIRVVNAGSSSQTYAESWAIAEALPRERVRAILVGMNYYRLQEGFEAVRRTLTSSQLPFEAGLALSSLLSDAGHSPGLSIPRPSSTAWLVIQRRAFTWGIASNEGGPVARNLQRAENGRFQGPRNHYTAPAKPLDEKERIVRRYLMERTVGMDMFAEQGARLWSGFATHFAQRGSTIGFLVLPASTTMKPAAAILEPAFRRQLAKLARTGASVIDMRGGQDLSEGDFYDQEHLLASGRAKFEPRLAPVIARLLNGCRGPGGRA